MAREKRDETTHIARGCLEIAALVDESDGRVNGLCNHQCRYRVWHIPVVGRYNVTTVPLLPW